MKNEKGAVTLYVTIVCLVILIIGISIYVGVANKQATQITMLNKIEQEYKSSVQTTEDLYQSFLGGEIVPVYTAEQFAKVGTGEQIYVEQTGKIYTFGTEQTYMFYGVAEDLTYKIKNELKTKIKEELKIELLEEGIKVSFIQRQKANAPELENNMVAVYWSKDGGKTASTFEEGASPIYSKIDGNGNPSSSGSKNPHFIEKNWYDYLAGYNSIDTKTSRWANAITGDGNYWVWIPRFKYKITNKPSTTDETSAGMVDVKFITIEDKSGANINGIKYTTKKNEAGEFITTDNDGYIIHPAFEDGSRNGTKAQGQNNYIEYANGEWDRELAGFWIAKYEVSGQDANGTAIEPEDVEISDNVKIAIKPNRTGWYKISVGNAYRNSYNYSRINDSHLIKMSEWGATAFLSISQYGRNGNEITPNVTNYITAYMGESGSTTGNIYGVYDMSGGLWEYNAAWDRLSTGTNLTNNGNITLNGYQYGFSGGSSTKYATAYENGTTTYNGSLAQNISKTGDAIKEVYIRDIFLWFSNYAGFGYNNLPFFLRGSYIKERRCTGRFRDFFFSSRNRKR